MKKACLATVAFLLVAVGGAAQDDESYYAASFARLNYVSGDVFVQRTSDLGYEKGEVNLALVQGDKIGTEAGHAEIHFGRRNFLRIGQFTQVEFALLPREGDDRIKLHVLDGSVYLRVSRLANEKDIEFHTPDASFYILEEGLYRVNVRPERETEFLVLEGSAEAAGEEGSLLVRAAERISAADGRFLGEPDRLYESQDEFGEWNATRDSLLAERSNTRYLPSEIDDYEEELGQSGRWEYERPYGYVWIPYAVDVGWRPYLYGRWVWYPVIGWNWVSFEPWGWAVYHYGRWHWRFGLGWYWIPHHHWRPAWVHWWHHPSYIGWCPLSWHNRPVVIVNNNFYDRHYDPYIPAGNRAMTVIRRNQLQSPNVARHVVAATELTSVGRIALKAEQPAVRPIAGVSGAQAARAQKVMSRSSAQAVPKSYGSVSNPESSERSPAVGSRSVVRRGSLSGSPGSSAEAPAGVVRSFPSRQSASPSKASAAEARPSGVLKSSQSVRRSEAASAGAGSAKGDSIGKSVSRPSGALGQTKKETASSGQVAAAEKKIKTYASSRIPLSSASRGRASGSSGAVQRRSSDVRTSYPSRLPTQRSSSVKAPSGSSRQAGVSRGQVRAYTASSGSSATRSSPRTSQSPRIDSAPKASRSVSSGSRALSSRTAPPSPARSSISRPSSSRSSAPRSMSAPRTVSAPRSSGSRSVSGSSSKSSASSSHRSATVKRKD